MAKKNTKAENDAEALAAAKAKNDANKDVAVVMAQSITTNKLTFSHGQEVRRDQTKDFDTLINDGALKLK